jgi:hypothetical protein
MIEKIILLPFWVLRKAFGLVFFAARMVFGTGAGAVRFVFARRLGTLVLVALAFLAGKKYLEESKKKEA